MSQENIINKTPFPRTRQSLVEDLQKVGLKPGMTVLVHSSLSSLGWICGGPVSVIQALIDVVTPSGTIMMPAHSSDYSDPAAWGNPPVPDSWWQPIRDTMPAFDPLVTPTWGMGKIAELFRTWPGVIRSNHPAGSFAAWGQYAEQLISGHSLNHSFGEESPIARVYDLDGWVLLLGIGYDSNTSFHLAEYRTLGYEKRICGAAIMADGQRVWKEYTDIEFDTDCFEELGAAFEANESVSVANVGSATARLFSQRRAIDFAEKWLGARKSK